MKKPRRVILFPDVHVPYHDTKAFELACKVVKKVKPDVLVILGDFADFYAVSSHDKDPNRRADLAWEVGEVNACLDIIEKLPAKKIVFCEGNHEQRLSRYLGKKAPELFNTVRVDRLFRIQERGWKWVPYRTHYKIGKLFVTHDYGRHGKYCAQQTLDAYQHNIAFGHSHRAAIYYSGNVAGEKHVSASLGWLGDPKQVDYVHQGQLREWTQGIGHAWVEANGNVHLNFLPFLNGRCIVPSAPSVVQ